MMDDVNPCADRANRFVWDHFRNDMRIMTMKCEVSDWYFRLRHVFDYAMNTN